MNADRFAGTRQLLRLILRLDRIKLALWMIGLLALVAITPFSLRAIIDAEAEAKGVSPEVVLAQQAVLLESNGASIALQGPPDALDTFGGRYAFEIGAFSLALVALMNILLIGRHTRAEEESGRAELVRAAAVGPWSALAAVGLVALAANFLLGLGTTVVFLIDGRAAGPSALFGLSITLCGVLFAAIALIWVQVFEYGRVATGMSLAGLALAFAVRAIGDVRGTWVSALSPLGWVQAFDPFGDITMWPLPVSLIAVAAFTWIAITLARRRDVGAGLIEQRAGPPTASSSLLTPLGFAWRLQKSSILWWTVGIGFMGAVYGSVISAIDDFIGENESMRAILEDLGMTGDALRDGFITVILSMVALLAMAGVIQSVLRPRSEEVAGRVEPLLAGAISRRQWLASHLLLSTLAAPLFMLAAGLGLTISDAAVVGHFTEPDQTIVAALTRVPALWTVAGIGALLYGRARHLTIAIWGIFAAVAIVFLFGDLLRLPEIVVNLSPIPHLTHLPGGGQGWLPVMVLCAIGALTGAIGIALFDQRDIDTT